MASCSVKPEPCCSPAVGIFVWGRGHRHPVFAAIPQPSGSSPPGKAQASNPRWMGPTSSAAQNFRGI